MKYLAVAVLLTGGCALAPSDHLPHEDAAYEAVVQAWGDAGMPATTSDCRLDLFRVLTPDAKETEQRCGVDTYKRIAACNVMDTAGRPLHLRQIPLIVISPTWHSEPGVIVHELLHAFLRCSVGGGDGSHHDPRIWSAVGGAESVQARAESALREEGWL